MPTTVTCGRVICMVQVTRRTLLQATIHIERLQLKQPVQQWLNLQYRNCTEYQIHKQQFLKQAKKTADGSQAIEQ